MKPNESDTQAQAAISDEILPGSTGAQSLIVACIDGSRLSQPVCDYACWVANKTEQTLKLLHTIEQLTPLPQYDLSGALSLGASEELLSELTNMEAKRRKLLIQQGQLILDSMRQYAAGRLEGAIHLEQRHGVLAEALISQEFDIAWVVMGIRGEAHELDEGLGAHLDSTIRSLHRPILVVNREYSTPSKVLLAYDGSEPSNKALDLVVNHPSFTDLNIHLVYVSQNTESGRGQSLLDDAKNQLAAAGRNVHAEILQGDIQAALVQYQAEQSTDLTVMGAYSHHRFRHFLMGSFTAKMLHATQQPVLLVH